MIRYHNIIFPSHSSLHGPIYFSSDWLITCHCVYNWKGLSDAAERKFQTGLKSRLVLMCLKLYKKEKKNLLINATYFTHVALLFLFIPPQEANNWWQSANTPRKVGNFLWITLAFEWKVQDGISVAFKERAEELRRCLDKDSFFLCARSERWDWLEVSDDLLSMQSMLIAPPSATSPLFLLHIEYHASCFLFLSVSAKPNKKNKKYWKKRNSALCHKIWTVPRRLKKLPAGPVSFYFEGWSELEHRRISFTSQPQKWI